MWMPGVSSFWKLTFWTVQFSYVGLWCKFDSVVLCCNIVVWCNYDLLVADPLFSNFSVSKSSSSERNYKSFSNKTGVALTTSGINLMDISCCFCSLCHSLPLSFVLSSVSSFKWKLCNYIGKGGSKKKKLNSFPSKGK